MRDALLDALVEVTQSLLAAILDSALTLTRPIHRKTRKEPRP